MYTGFDSDVVRKSHSRRVFVIDVDFLNKHISLY